MKNPNIEELYRIIVGIIDNTNPTISQEIFCHMEIYCKFKKWTGRFKMAKIDEHVIDNLADEFRYCVTDGAKYAYSLTKTKYYPEGIYSYGTVRTLKQMKSFVNAAKRDGEIISVFDFEQGTEVEL